MRKQIFFLILVLAAPFWLTAQNDVSFEAYADAKEILLNSFFEVTFSLKNAEGSDFQSPSFSDFVVVGGPSRGVSTRIINGQVTKEMSYTYSLKPRRTGRFTIGSASVTVDGKTLRTDPVEISVVRGASGEGGDEASFFIRAEPSVEKAFIGQQISLDYKLYTSINIESYNVLDESDYPGFYAEDLKRYDSRVMREIIDGQQYTTKVLKRVALFPQQAGRLTIDPMQLQLGIVEGDSKPSNAFFFNRRIRRLLAQTDPVDIQVVPLPADPPPSFTGAVGQFSINTNLSRTTLTTDDVLSLKLTIRGNGDIKRALPPQVSFPDTFEVYEPKVLEEDIREVRGFLVSEKTFEYLALPKAPGNYDLHPQFSYFDPDSAKYIVLNDKTFSITVRPGTRQPSSTPVLPREETAALGSDIRHIKRGGRLFLNGRSFFASPSFWALSLAPFVLLGGIIVIRRVRKQRENEDPAQNRRRQARKVALQHLQTADLYRQNGQAREFYDEVSKAMIGYVGDKLQIPGSAMTKEKVREKLHDLQVPEPAIDRFLSVIQTCEIALFAGKDQSEAMNTTYENAAGVIAEVEEGSKKR